MISSIRQKELFQPSFLGVFLNPLYLIRKPLYLELKRNKNQMKGVILDFGCGRKPYKNLFNFDNYIGLDIEVSGHDHSNEDIDVFYDGKKIPFEDEYFDSIFSTEVFEHVFEIDNILEELNRVCKKNGTILLTVPFIIGEHEQPYDYCRYTSFGLKYLLNKHGFEVLSQAKVGSSISVICQLSLTYLIGIIPKIPFLYPILAVVGTTLINSFAILFEKIFPNSSSIFLNQVIVGKKL